MVRQTSREAPAPSAFLCSWAPALKALSGLAGIGSLVVSGRRCLCIPAEGVHGPDHSFPQLRSGRSRRIEHGGDSTTSGSLLALSPLTPPWEVMLNHESSQVPNRAVQGPCEPSQRACWAMDCSILPHKGKLTLCRALGCSGYCLAVCLATLPLDPSVTLG